MLSFGQLLRHGQLVPEWSDLFADHARSGDTHCVVIQHDGWLPPRSMDIAEAGRRLATNDVFVVLLNSGDVGRMQKLAAFFLRDLTVRRIHKTMRRHAIAPNGSYALFPGLQSVRVVYERRTAAGR